MQKPVLISFEVLKTVIQNKNVSDYFDDKKISPSA